MSFINTPSVSVIIPTYNEVDNIEAIIRQFLESKYSNLLEVLIVDGQSTDGTPEKVMDLSRLNNKIKLLQNPLRIQSAALNIGLEASQGDIFLRADAHCDYAPDYIEQCVAALQNSDAINVGGAQRFVAANTFQAGIALASRSLLGSGGAKYRDPNYDGYAETVFLGCFKRSALANLGGYEVTRKEDSELNFRLLQAQGDRAIYISSKIKVWYFPRKNWLGLWQQYIKYGRGSYLMSQRYAKELPLRNKIPFFGLLLSILALIADLTLLNGSLHAIAIIMIGASIVAIEAGRVTLKYSKKFTNEFWRNSHKASAPNLVSRWFCCGMAIATMPIAHFTGYGYQLFLIKIMGNQDNCFFESKSSIPSKESPVKTKIKA
jgi:succinoglycan biosynthesis protein ExoA